MTAAFQFMENPSSKKLIILFADPSSYDMWGLEAHLRKAANVLVIRVNEKTWYQNGVPGLGKSLEETISSITTWQRNHKISKTYCLGQSVGGYGALLFAGFLDAKGMAFGGETVLGVPHGLYVRRANKAMQITHGNLSAMFRSGINAIHIVGERDPVSLYCAAQSTEVPRLKVTTLQRVGTQVAQELHAQGVLTRLLTSWLQGTRLAGLPAVGMGLTSDRFASNFYVGWCKLREKNYETAVDYLTLAAQAYPEHDAVRLHLGRAYHSLGAHQEALAQFTATHEMAPQADALNGIGVSLRMIGDILQARQKHQEVITSWPEDAAGWYNLGLCDLNLGQKNVALVHFRRAAELDPKNKSYAARVKALEAKM